jgi:DNA-binding NtrC family response regulator
MTSQKPASILVVDDNPDNRDLLVRHLHRQGYASLTAENGRQALDIMKTQPIDLVLLDLMMPEINGMEVLERIQQDPELQGLPVVVVTAIHEWDSVGKCIELGAVDYLVKPFNSTVLKSRVASCIEKKRLRDVEQAHQEELARSKTQLEHLNEELTRRQKELTTIFNQLNLGTLMTTAEGHISFMSDNASHMLNQRVDDILGKPWGIVLPVKEPEKSDLYAMLQRPSADRAKVSVSLDVSQKKRIWLEVDVKDDPQCPERKIFFLYDTTEIHNLRRLLSQKAHFQDLVGKSSAMQEVYRHIEDVASLDVTVLITGETGTGKELVAQAIHSLSPRKDKPFLAVNCAGLTETLLGSQLFGHKKGAFTGATEDHKGFFEAAEGGTLFLDEIGDMPLTIQATLLRTLQEKEVLRLGESHPRKVNVRIVTATNQDLETQVTINQFRSDLLYRIRIGRIHLPPLRERREDIPLLAQNFLQESLAATGKTGVHDISSAAMQSLMPYTWPGNVRELKGALEYALIHCRNTSIESTDLPSEILDSPRDPSSKPQEDQDEDHHILSVLKQTRGNRSKAAKILGMSRSTFYRRLSALGLLEEE